VEQEVSDLEATFAAPDFYAKPRSEIFELETQLKTARDKVAHLYARWHELELLQTSHNGGRSSSDAGLAAPSP
jgi:ATP-binding cassette subfamily F protein uup